MKSGGVIDYRRYQFSKMEVLKYYTSVLLAAFTISYFFYAHLIISLVVSPFGLCFIPWIKKQLNEKRKKELKREFKEGIYCLASSIYVGKSIEKAFVDALDDLKMLGIERNRLIIGEFEVVVRKIMNNETIEEALIDFAVRAFDEDITDFANVFVAANRSGGNLIKIMQFTTNVINEKMAIEDKINVLLAEKKYEQKIMWFLLPFMMVYLRLFSAGFMDVMYETVKGRVTMTIVLLLYSVSFWLGNRIVGIEV